MNNKLGDAPIQNEYRAVMNDLAKALDHGFNGQLRGAERKVGFVLLMFEFGGKKGGCNYISNADRKDVVTLLKEQIKHFEG